MPLLSPFFRLPGRWTRRRARRTRMTIQFIIFTILFLVIIPAYIIYKPPKFVIGYFQRRFPDVLFQVETRQKIVALSIDDAPTEFTRQILQILKANDAHATFFVIGGQVEGRDAILKDVVLAGHELGNHAMHDEPSISLSSSTLAAEIARVDSFINHAYESADVERPSRLFRPGSGVFSRRILEVVAQAGYKTILGSIYPHDPFISRWWLNAWHILSMLRPGAVIICHDRRSWTLPMLQKIIPEIKRRGFEIVTVTKLMERMAD